MDSAPSAQRVNRRHSVHSDHSIHTSHLGAALAAGLLAERGPARRIALLTGGLVAGAGAAGVTAAAEWASARWAWKAPNPVCLVVNQDSGSARLARRARRALRREAEAVTERRGPGRALDAAIHEAIAELSGREGARLVVAGGDGTVGRALQLAAGAEVAVGILPTGTGNDIARSLGVPLYPEEAAAVALRGTIRRVDLVETDLGTFAHAAGVGILAAFAGSVRDVRSWRRPLLYPVRAWRAWRGRQPLDLQIAVDGAAVAMPAPPLEVALINAPRMGGRVGLALPAARPDDGRMEMVAVYRGAARNALAGLVHYLQARAPGPPVGGVARSASRVELRSPEPFAVSLDGEPAGRTTELTARVRPGAAAVVVPRPWQRRGSWR